MSDPNCLIDVPRGLDGVVVDTTHVSNVDGAAGHLSYRGISVDELVDLPFSEVAVLVATGQMDKDLAARLDVGVDLASDEVEWVRSLDRRLHPMHVLQALIPILKTDGPFETLEELGAALTIATKLPHVLALHLESQTGVSLHIPVRQDINGRFLDRIGVPDDELSRRAFGVMQILQMEHSFNASTYAARVVASTLAPIQNALAAGVGTLHGILHGGADQAALETADRVGSASLAPDFVDRCLACGEKVMGMGHREYRVVDPRAKYAKTLARQITENTRHFETYRTLEAIEARFSERMAEKGRALHANIEFYKGVIFRALGLPNDYFTSMFAMARVYGYTAHILESRQDNKLIRPSARYVPA